MSRSVSTAVLLGLSWSVGAQADKDTLSGLKDALFGKDANAGGTTAQQLVASCRYGHAEDRKRSGFRRDAWEEGICVGYFKGFLESLHTAGTARNLGLCIPEEFFHEFRRPDAFGDPFRSIFLGWAVRHPDDLERPAATVALDALTDAWPCDVVQTDSEPVAEGAPIPKSAQSAKQ